MDRKCFKEKVYFLLYDDQNFFSIDEARCKVMEMVTYEKRVRKNNFFNRYC